MAFVVLQGLFPPPVDLPSLQTRSTANYSHSETETAGELDHDKFEILGQVTSTLADSIVHVIMTLDPVPTVAEPELNKTDSEAEDDFVYSVGRFTIINEFGLFCK